MRVRRLFVLTAACSLVSGLAGAATTTVSSISQLQSAINGANPGDTIIVTNGSYTTSGAITVNRAGSSSAPITITAQSIGGVTISGSAGFALQGNASYVTIRGFRFTHSGALTTAVGSDHCRISRNHFQRSGGGQYLVLYGFDHEVDYNRLQDRVGSPTITLDKNLSDSWPTHGNTSRIHLHHNHFLRSSNTATNGGESIQTWAGFTRAEFNLFEETNGDPEVISSKASDCIYRYNTFRTITRGQLTLRYARRCTVEGNFFINTPGMRVYGDNHKIRNNYHENANLTMGDGKSGYLPIVNMEIAFNTFVNSAITRNTGDTPPSSTRIANNIFFNGSGSAVTHGGSITFEGNIVWGGASAGTMPTSGYRSVDPQLVRNANGIYHLSSSSPAIDSSAGSYSLPDDLDGQPRSGAKDVGADEVSTAAVTRVALVAADVGPSADLGPTPTPTPTPTSTPAEPTPTPTATATPCPSCTFIEITPAASGVTASTHDGNLPGNTVDNSLATRWSANGDGQWIKYDLGSVRTVAYVSIAVYNGNSRQNRFDLQVSSDNVAWTTVIPGGLTSGTTTAEQIHDFDDVAARFVRYLGHGSTVSTFNSVTEISVFGPGAPTPTATPTPVPTETPTPTPTATPGGAPVEVTPGGSAVTASTSDTNLPANTVDNNLATRWSGNGDGAWIQYDLGTARTVAHVNVAVYNGNSRQNIFDIQVSTGAGVWTTVWSGRSSGTTTAEETYEFADVPARWVRYLGHGSTANSFNSVTEVSIFAVP